VTHFACVQLLVEEGDVEANLARILAYIGQASELGADIVCFPELSTCGYARDLRACAEEVRGGVVSELSAAAREKQIYVLVGLPELCGDRIYNSALLLDRQGEPVGRYHKTHLALDTRGGTVAAEADTFAAGDTYPVFVTDFGRMGIMICKDGLFPEVARIYTLRGCELLFWLNNRGELNPCHLEMNANVNRVVVVASNVAAGLTSDGGGSAIVYFEDMVYPNSEPDSFRHTGSFLARAGKEETMVCAEVDMDYARRRREAWFNRWLNRRPEIYGPLVGWNCSGLAARAADDEVV